MQHDIVIVGAGPVGPMLACELRLAGAEVAALSAAGFTIAPQPAFGNPTPARPAASADRTS